MKKATSQTIDKEKQLSIQDNRFTFSDLFAGIGGFHHALHSIGGECLYAVEWDKYARITYEENFSKLSPNIFNNNRFYGDITKIEVNDLPKVDVLCAGFPCQPFSTIGKREGFEHKTQGTLFFNIMRILTSKNKPKAIILENVKGLEHHDNNRTLKVILESLKEAGYINPQFKVLNSADFGVPQIRERIFIIAFHKKYKIQGFEFPKGDTPWKGIGRFVEEINDSRYDISEHLQKSYLFKKDDGRPQIIDKSTLTPVKTLVSTYHKIQRLTGTFVKGGTTGLRLLSINECKAIQGFPAEFKVPVSRTQAYRQLGNAVAVPVVIAVAKKVINSLENVKAI